MDRVRLLSKTERALHELDFTRTYQCSKRSSWIIKTIWLDGSSQGSYKTLSHGLPLFNIITF